MHSFSRASAGRTVLILAATLLVTACSGGSSGTGNAAVPFNQANCDGGTQTQLARPFPNSSGNGNVTSIEIVASGNNNQLGQSFMQYDLLVAPVGVAPTQGFATGFLSAVSDTSGPHPYGQDFFYSGSLQNGSLGFGQTYNVYLNAPNSNCQAVYQGTFST